MTTPKASKSAVVTASTTVTAKSPGSAQDHRPTAAQFGDMMHMLTLCSTFAFAYMVALHFDIFDDEWKKEGFCVTNREVDYWTSHDMCFYVDSLAALVFVGVYFLFSSSQTSQVNKEFLINIPGIFGHGLAHRAIGGGIRSGIIDPNEAWSSMYNTMQRTGLLAPEVVQGAIANTVFWLCLLKGILPKLSYGMVVAFSIVIMSFQMFVPLVFGFTYVQTVLLVLFTVAQISRPVEEKGYSYGLYAALVGFPLVLVSILESTLCSTFVKDWLYGHVVYDAYIPVSVLAWYLLCHKQNQSTKLKEA